MKVLIADKFEKVGVDGLKELGCTVVSQPDVKAEELPGAIRATDPHILIVRGKKVSGDALKAGTALTLVIRAGAGIDTIDVATASSRACSSPTVRARTRSPSPSWCSASCSRATGAFPTRWPSCAPGPGTRASSPRGAACTAGRSASWGWGRSGGRSRCARARSACA